MKKLDRNLKSKMDSLFFWFEENKFKNDGIYRRDTNLIFEFADWIDKKETRDIVVDHFALDFLDGDLDQQVDDIIAKFSAGINSYLERKI